MQYKETENLKRLQNFVNEMKNTSSLLKKKDIIKNYENDAFITKALHYVYNPYKQFYVTSKTCKKMSHLADDQLTSITGDNPNDSFFSILDDLNERLFTGHDAITMIVSYINAYPEFEDLLYSIVDKNLQIRASESVINKVIPGLIPAFNVALASNYESKLVDFKNETWYASRKLDGVRCVVIVDENGKANAYSRQGKQFETLGKVLKDFEDFGQRGFAFDGELCLIDKNGNEDFQGVMKQIRRKDHTIPNPKYKIFDFIPLDDFNKKESSFPLSDRLEALQEMKYFFTGTSLSVLPQVIVKNDSHFAELNADAQKEGYEGLMLRKDVSYQGKRTKNLLKVKSFCDSEYEVVGCDFDEHRVIREGKEVVLPMLSQVYIEHKGHQVAVGSGFSQQQRLTYFEFPEQIIGKLITVQYFEETTNQKGGISLRFPTVKHIYEGVRDC